MSSRRLVGWPTSVHRFAGSAAYVGLFLASPPDLPNLSGIVAVLMTRVDGCPESGVGLVRGSGPDLPDLVRSRRGLDGLENGAEYVQLPQLVDFWHEFQAFGAKLELQS